MKILLSFLLFLSFLQTTILPLNLVLIVLIVRAFIKEEKNNLYLAFAFGLIISHLTLQPLGLLSIIYLVIVGLVHLLSHSRFAKHFLLIIPLTFVMLLSEQIVVSFINNKAIFISWKIIFETAITLPLYFILRIWEERFIVKKEIKLKINS